MAPYINTTEGAYTSEIFQVNISSNQAARVQCRWKLHEAPSQNAVPYFHSLDLLLNIQPLASGNGEALPSDATGSVLETLVRKISAGQNLLQTEVAAVAILAPDDGYLSRSDILETRMNHSEFINATVSFGSWDQRIPAFYRHNQRSLLSLLLSSPGAVIAKKTPASSFEDWELLHQDLEARFSINWLLPKKPSSYKVALVAGRNRYEGGGYRVEGLLDAARALGIAVTILDAPGHWLQGEEFAHLRHDFVPVDLSFDAELPRRIADALIGKDVDGIVTVTDDYVLATGEAADILGLPTEPIESMRLALHKDKLRKIVNGSSIQSIFLQDATQLSDPAIAKQLDALQYPLIVKPAYGRASAGVKKVTDTASMREAVRMVTADGLDEEGIVVEKFIDGPELDCNFVMYDGEILFLEVTDDLPSAGDATDATLEDTFFETAMISHSGLPVSEQNAVRQSLQRGLQKLGLKSGVFHLEARMLNSSMRYADRGDGVLDLVANDPLPSADPDAFLIEVNVRPPGIGGAFSTLYTYGVDYSGLHLLRAVDDRERFIALSQGFPFPASVGSGGGAQYWTAHGLIPVHRENILIPRDFIKKVYKRIPDVVPYVSKAELNAAPGSVVSPSGGVGLIAYFLLFSRKGRTDVLEMYHRVAKAATAVLDEETYARPDHKLNIPEYPWVKARITA